MKEVLQQLKNLCKCHWYYLFNKINIIISLATIFIVAFFSFSIANSIDSYLSIVDRVRTYYISIYQILKLVTLINTIMIFGYSFTNNLDQYRVLIISKNIKRKKYLNSKLFILFVVYAIIYILLVLITTIVGTLFDYYYTIEMIKSFFDLFIIGLFYGNLSIICIYLIDNIYYILLLLPISFISVEKWKFVGYILPQIDIENNQLIDNRFSYFLLNGFIDYRIYIILIVLLLFFLINLIYSKRDLQN